MSLIVIYAVYLSIALLLAIGVITAIVTSVAVVRHWSRLLLPMIISLLMIGGAVGVVLAGRDLNYSGLATVIAMLEPAGTGRWINRGFVALIVALCIGVIVGMFVNRQPFPVQGRTLFVGFLLYYVTMSLVPSVFGTQPAFLHNQIYPLLIMAAVFLSARPTPVNFAVFAKWLFFAFILGGLLAALAKPDLVLQQNYHGWIPGFDSRFWGLASHANLIGPAALTLLLLEYLQPTRNWLLRSVLILSGVLVLVLAQSKTTWMAGLLAMGFLISYRKIPELVEALRTGGQIPLSTVFYLGGLLFGLLGLVTALLVVDPDRLIGSIMASDVGSALETASGRDLIWSTALEEWKNNWFFGYGPLVWGDLYRFQHGMFTYAFHAHNQFLQTVSMGGGFALMGLLVYVWLLITYSVRAASSTKGVSVAILLILLLRSLTEVPLPQHAHFSLDFLMHIVFFMILVLHDRKTGHPQVAVETVGPDRNLALGMPAAR